MNKRLAVLVSSKGTGSNLLALIKSKFNISLVLADKEEAPGIKIAKENGLRFEIFPYKNPDLASPQKYRDMYSLRIATSLNKYKIDIAVLAGFNRILTKPYFQTFKKPTINIHPGAIPDREDSTFEYKGELLPWNKSMMTEVAVANFIGLKNASSTIHIVTEKADFGPVLKRVFVNVSKNDGVESLYKRLKTAEHEGLSSVLKKL